jgi:murein DD-endopeptidase MepM/ murein hydrolase activator NlpD
MRKLSLLVVLIIVLGLVGFVFLRVGPAPTISIEPAARVIGQNTPVTVRVAEPRRGLSTIKVELVQGDAVSTLTEKRHEPVPAWALWRKGTPSDALRVEVGKATVADLRPGTATVRVTAGRASVLFWAPRAVTAQVELPVRLVPPTLQVLSTFHYVSRGGSEAVVYRVGEGTTRDGVQSGSRFFPGYPLPGGAASDRFALFAVAYDMEDASSVRLIAQDAAGNAAERKFVDQFFPKPVRRDTIHLSDAFMQKVTTEIMSQTPGLADKGNLLDNYLQINRDLRKTNDAFLEQLAQKSQLAFLWREPFLPMVNTAIKANFAERRAYEYQGKTVDEQNHLGLDMASFRADPVPVSNDGVVASAAYLGIYGNCVVVDHGYGLQTLYGHLSSIDVKAGQQVKRGETIGRSGATGLAGGDHVHFAVMLHGLPVTPIEWFDNKWINDRLKLKLGSALPFERAAKAAKTRGRHHRRK